MSLKAETSGTEPTENDRPNKAASARDGKGTTGQQQQQQQQEQQQGGGNGEHKTLKEVAQGTNASQLGDPVSLKAETADSEPTENDRPVTGGGKSKL